MFAWTDLATYVAVVALLFLIPGPAVLLTLARSISGGPRAGIATGFGIAAGDAVHTLMAVIGLSAILMTSALAFDIVKYLGAAYLIYLGVRSMLERAGGGFDLPSVKPLSGAIVFRQAFLTEILNPKTALFVDPARGAVSLQLLVLGAIFVVMSMAYTSLLAWAAGAFAGFLKRNEAIARWQNKVVGGIYIGLGLQLAMQERR
jgi:threonine/homoserine/homoserine lactone efflux protein